MVVGGCRWLHCLVQPVIVNVTDKLEVIFEKL